MNILHEFVVNNCYRTLYYIILYRDTLTRVLTNILNNIIRNNILLYGQTKELFYTYICIQT